MSQDPNRPVGEGVGEGQRRLAATAEEAREEAARRAAEYRDAVKTEAEGAAARLGAEAERARGQLRDEVDDVADAVGQGARELDPNSFAGQLMRQASHALEDVARSVEGKSLDAVARDLSDVARRNPMAFLGAAALAGFAVSRVATATDSAPSPRGPAERPAGSGMTSAPGGTGGSTPPMATAGNAPTGQGPHLSDPGGTIR